MCEGGGTGTGIVRGTYWRDWSDYECVRWGETGTGVVRGTYWRDWSDWSDLAAYCRAWPSNSCRCSSVLEITLVGLDAIDSTVF